jgi:hypothetical protein
MSQVEGSLSGEPASQGGLAVVVPVGRGLRPEVQEPQVVSHGFYWRAWQKFRRDPVSMAAGVLLLIVILVTTFGPIYAQQVQTSALPSSVRQVLAILWERTTLVEMPLPGCCTLVAFP